MEWLLRHGANPNFNRAEALSVVLGRARGQNNVQGHGVALLVPLLNAGLHPELLRTGWFQYFFHDVWPLARLRPEVRRRLRGVEQELETLAQIERALRMMVGGDLAGYLLAGV